MNIKDKTIEHRQIASYPNYEITLDGRVWSNYSNKYLKYEITDKGYLKVRLNKGGKSKHFKVHRLVAKHFLQNPHNKPQVNHKDHNKTNNHISNLEWHTDLENRTHAINTGYMKVYKLYQYDLEGGLINIYQSFTECINTTDYKRKGIENHLYGEAPHYKGYLWRLGE